jgi:hypothetical protein
MGGRRVLEQNWAKIKAEPSLLEHIKIPKPHYAFRFQGVGDIFNLTYLFGMFNCCNKYPTKQFWCYTRSTNILREVLDLNEIHRRAGLPEPNPIPTNLTMFISIDQCNVDTALPFARKYRLPPAFMGRVPGSEEAFVCPKVARPEDFPETRVRAEAPCLAKCGYCWDPGFTKARSDRGVLFLLHGLPNRTIEKWNLYPSLPDWDSRSKKKGG